MARGSPLNNEIRSRIIEAYNKGNSCHKISEIFGINRTTIHNIIKRYLSTGEMENKSRITRAQKKLSEEQENEIKSWVDQNCTISLNEISRRCSLEFGISICKSTAANILAGFSYTLKRLHIIPERRNTIETINARNQFALSFIELPSRYSENEIIYIDEVGFNVSIRSSMGRSLIGTSANLVVPAIRSRNISICCAINRVGIIIYESRNSAYNSLSNSSFLNNLMTRLRELSISNAIWIMDNVRFHKTLETETTILNAGFQYLYLLPYSPFLNPIENMFSKWKEHVKGGNPNNERKLMNLIEKGSLIITSEDVEGYYRNIFRHITRCINKEEILD